MVNNFKINHQESTKHRELMRNFYIYISPPYAEPFYLDDKTHFEQVAQKILKIDVLLPGPGGHLVSYEEKIVKWPANNEPYPDFYAETDSCTLPRRWSPGWMETCEADFLIYVFERPDGLDVHKIPFQSFKRWFWQEMDRNPNKFKMSTNKEENQTRGARVNIVEVHTKVAGTERFFLRRDGYCTQIKINTSIPSLLTSSNDDPGDLDDHPF